MVRKLTVWISITLFLGSFVLMALAGLEVLSNQFGYTVLRGYSPWRFLEFASVALLFVIAQRLLESNRSGPSIPD